MQAFELEDKSKPGSCSIAAILLVDPNRRIISTSDVPPQQHAWHAHASGLSDMFTAEVNAVIADKQDFPITVNRAKWLREELMEDRAWLTERGNGVDRQGRSDWFHRKLNEVLYI